MPKQDGGMEFRANLARAGKALNGAGFKLVGKHGMSVIYKHNMGGYVQLYEQGTGWIAGCYQIGIMAGLPTQSWGKDGPPELMKQAYGRATRALSKQFNVIGTLPYSQVVRPKKAGH